MLVLVDATDVSGTLIPSLRNLIGGNPLLAVATKVDLLPKQTRGPREFQGWLRGVMRAKGMVPLQTLQVRSEAVVWRKMAHEQRTILTQTLLSEAWRRPFSIPALPSTQRQALHPQVSSKTMEGISRAAAAIRKERRGRDVYVIGAANVGKSAFLRALVR